MLAISGPSYFIVDSPTLSFFVQAARELGYYGYDIAPFKPYLSIKTSKDYLRRLMLPEDMRKMKFDKTLSNKIVRFLKKNDPKMIFADEPTGALNRKSSDEVMNELLSLNHDGTTVMCVTHDPKVAAKCSRVLYIVDGGIMGEKEMGHFDGSDKELRDRERDLNNWLMEQGW